MIYDGDSIESEESDAFAEVLSPFTYFKRYISKDMFQTMAENTNIYAVQNDKSRFKPTDANEIKTLTALHLATGIF